jgi:SAM-dependent methyltransferase
MNINGSPRAGVLAHNPASYLGVDSRPGPGVDEICNVYDLVERFGENYCDILISMEMLEHVCDWRSAVHQHKAVLKPGGLLILTTRSQGFMYHGFPYDFWRYELDDIKYIFGDLRILELSPDPSQIGILLAARKKKNWKNYSEAGLGGMALYCILCRNPVLAITDEIINTWYAQWVQNIPEGMEEKMQWITNPIHELKRIVNNKGKL